MLLLVLGTLQACRTVYAPNAVNNPLLQEKGELKALVAVNNLQAAYAVTDHIGIMANGYYNSFTSDDKQFHNKGHAFEIGAGYFKPMANRLTFEVYGGGGMFRVSMDEDGGTKDFKADAARFFIQPGIGWVHPFVEVGLSSRLSSIRYASPEIRGYTASERNEYHFNTLSSKPHWFLEPALTVRGGYKWIKLQFQYGKAVKLSDNQINFDDNLGSIGLVFNVAQWYNR